MTWYKWQFISKCYWLELLNILAEWWWIIIRMLLFCIKQQMSLPSFYILTFNTPLCICHSIFFKSSASSTWAYPLVSKICLLCSTGAESATAALEHCQSCLLPWSYSVISHHVDSETSLWGRNYFGSDVTLPFHNLRFPPGPRLVSGQIVNFITGLLWNSLLLRAAFWNF